MRKIFLSLSLASALLAINFNDAAKPNRSDINDANYIISFNENIKKAQKSCLLILAGDKIGSGVIISNDGYIITNNHVLKESNLDSINVYLEDKHYKAAFIASDDDYDLAVLKIKGKFEAIKIANSDDVLVGDVVFAIGNPFLFVNTVTKGIVTNLNQSLGLDTYESRIQTDAAINPGNSGGALVNTKGDLIGINAAGKYDQAGGFSANGFAIPSNVVKFVAEQLIKTGMVNNPTLGLQTASIDSELIDSFDGKTGVLVLDVEKGSLAEEAGIKVGDIIDKINDKIIYKNYEAIGYIMSQKPNSKITLNIFRNNKNIQTSFTLKAPDIEDIRIAGLSVQNTPDNSGVVVNKVFLDSFFRGKNISKKDKIIRVQDQEIKNTKDFAKAMKRPKPFTRVWLNRKGEIIIIVI